MSNVTLRRDAKMEGVLGFGEARMLHSHQRLLQDGSMRKLMTFAAVLMVVSACESNSATEVAPQRSNLIQSTTRLNIDDAFSAVAEVLPSFGGLSYDSAGNVRVFMRPPYDEAQAIAVLTDFLTERISPYQSPIFRWRFLTAEYTWPELLAIRRTVAPLAMTSGFVYLDADESHNRITIAVSNAEAEARIRAAMTISRVDEQAVGFIRQPYSAAHSIDRSYQAYPSWIRHRLAVWRRFKRMHTRL